MGITTSVGWFFTGGHGVCGGAARPCVPCRASGASFTSFARTRGVVRRLRRTNSEGRRIQASTARRDRTNSTAHMDPSHYADAQAFRANFKDIEPSVRARAAVGWCSTVHAHEVRSSGSSRPPPTRRTRGGRASTTWCRRWRRSASSCTRTSSTSGSWHTPAGLNILMEYANGGSLQHEIVGRARGRSGTTRTSSSITSCRWCRRSRWCTPPASSTATSSRRTSSSRRACSRCATSASPRCSATRRRARRRASARRTTCRSSR